MKLSHEDFEQVRLIRLEGQFHTDQTERLSKLVSEGIEAGNRDLVLNLARLDHIDSQALATLLDIQDQFVQTPGQCRLASCPDDLRTVLRMTRLAGQFNCDADEQSAIGELCRL